MSGETWESVVIETLDGIIKDIKSGKKRVLDVGCSRPVREKPLVSWEAKYKEYELTGDCYLRIHFREDEKD